MLGTTEALVNSLRGLTKLQNFSAESPFKPIYRRDISQPVIKPQFGSSDFKENLICIPLTKEIPVDKVADIKRQYQQAPKVADKTWSQKKRKAEWNAYEDASLLKLVEKFGDQKWTKVSKFMRAKSEIQCFYRWLELKDNCNVSKGPWTVEEDEMLRKLVEGHGARNWSSIAEKLPGRIGKQCRERWHNHLDPSIKKEKWTMEEDKMILKLHFEMGNRWCEMAKHLPGRTDNAIKNRFNSKLKKQISSIKTALFDDQSNKPFTIDDEILHHLKKRDTKALLKMLERNNPYANGLNSTPYSSPPLMKASQSLEKGQSSSKATALESVLTSQSSIEGSNNALLSNEQSFAPADSQFSSQMQVEPQTQEVLKQAALRLNKDIFYCVPLFHPSYYNPKPKSGREATKTRDLVSSELLQRLMKGVSQ